MRNSTLFVGIVVAIAAAGIAVCSVQADPPKQTGNEDQLAQRGGPPWTQGRGGSAPPWARNRGGGAPWMQTGGPPWMQVNRQSGPPPWVVARMRGGGGPWVGGRPPWMQGGGHGEQRAARFDRLDSNHDGKISKEEVLAMHAKADANDDGAVTREELSKHIQSVGGGPLTGRRGGQPFDRGGGRPSAATLFKSFDSNKDGKLSMDEVPVPVWKRLGNADADDDGAVTKAEFKKAAKAKGAE